MAISFLSRSYRTRGNKSISFSFLLLFKRYILLDSDKVMGDHAALNSEGVCLLSRCSSLSLFIKISLYLDTSFSVLWIFSSWYLKRYLFLTLILDKLMIRLLKVKHINEMKKQTLPAWKNHNLREVFMWFYYFCILWLHTFHNSGKSNMIKTNRNSLFGKLEKFWEQYSNINLGWSAEAEVWHCN